MTENKMSNLVSAPIEHTVRLLYPFWLDAGGLDKAVEALCQLRHQGHKDSPKKPGTKPRASPLYTGRSSCRW